MNTIKSITVLFKFVFAESGELGLKLFSLGHRVLIRTWNVQVSTIASSLIMFLITDQDRSGGENASEKRKDFLNLVLNGRGYLVDEL